MKTILCVPTLTAYESLYRLIVSAENNTIKPDKYVIIDNDAFNNRYSKISSSFKKYIQGKNFSLDNIEIIEPDYNWGVSASWNYFMKKYPDDIVIISNDDILLTEKSIENFISSIQNNKNKLIYADNLENSKFSFFHLSQDVYKTVGEFDENFYPAYYEDCDYKTRLRNNNIEFVEVQGVNLTHDTSLTFRKKNKEELEEHHVFFKSNKNYYIRKWGGNYLEEKFTEPFNGNKDKLLLCFPTLSRYDLLCEAILSAERGNVAPDKYVVLDNGFPMVKNNIKGFRHFIEANNVALPMDKIEIIEQPRNAGVAASWNYFIKNYIEHNIIISNDDIIMYENTIEELLKAKKENHNEKILIYTCNCHKNNAFCFFSPLFKTVKVLGYFDENFYPAYYEDCDYNRRMLMSNGYNFYSVSSCEFKHLESQTLENYNEIEKQNHHRSFIRNKHYYISKWGGDHGEEKFKKPFDLKK